VAFCHRGWEDGRSLRLPTSRKRVRPASRTSRRRGDTACRCHWSHTSHTRPTFLTLTSTTPSAAPLPPHPVRPPRSPSAAITLPAVAGLLRTDLSFRRRLHPTWLGPRRASASPHRAPWAEILFRCVAHDDHCCERHTNLHGVLALLLSLLSDATSSAGPAQLPPAPPEAAWASSRLTLCGLAPPSASASLPAFSDCRAPYLK
jgi:hypothetical protein